MSAKTAYLLSSELYATPPWALCRSDSDRCDDMICQIVYSKEGNFELFFNPDDAAFGKTKVLIVFIIINRRIAVNRESRGQSRVVESTMKARSQQHEEAPRIVLVPKQCDILCGTGRSVSNHPGNVRFRGIAEKHVEEYAKAYTKPSKSRVVKSIVFETHASGARILKKHPVHLWWNVVEDRGSKVLRDKTTHYLRTFLEKRPAGGIAAPSQVQEPNLFINDHQGHQGKQEKDSKFIRSKVQLLNSSSHDLTSTHFWCSTIWGFFT